MLSSLSPLKFRMLAGIVVILCVVGVAVWHFSSAITDEERFTIVVEKIAQGDFETVKEHLEILVSRDPGNTELLLYLFDTCLRLDDIEAAFGTYQSMANVPPPLIVQNGLRLASASFLSGDEQITRDCLEGVLRAEPGNESAIRAKLQLESLLLRREAVRECVAMLDKSGLAQPFDLFSFYMTDEPKWDGPEQVEWLKKSLAQTPDNPRTLAALIRVYTTHGEFSLAAQLITSIQNRDLLNRSEIVIARAFYELESGEIEISANILKTLSDPKLPPFPWRLRGRIMSTLGDQEGASEAFQKVLALDPSDLPSLAALIKLNSSTRPGDLATEEYIKTVKYWNQYLQIRSDALSTGSISDQQLQNLVEGFIRLKLMRPAAICLNAISTSSQQDSSMAQSITLLNKSPDSLKPLELSKLDGATWKPFDLRSHFASSPAQSEKTLLVDESENYFKDVTTEANLNFEHESGHLDANVLLQSLGSGVAAVDFDLDGWPDLAFPQGGLLSDENAGKKPDQLFRNLEGQSFSKVTSQAGFHSPSYSHGCASGDFNNDGFQDLFLSGFGRNTLLYNNGDGTFHDVTVAAEITDESWSTTSAWYDLDRDGDLDLYVVGYCDASLPQQLLCEQESQASCRPVSFLPQRDYVWINQGDGRFADSHSQFSVDSERGLGVLIEDFDNDQKPEIFVGNDMGPNFFFVETAQNNEKPSRPNFVEQAHLSGVAVSGEGVAEACMGIATTDFDRNGDLDLLVTNYENETNTFYTNLGGIFSDQTRQLGLAVPSQSMLAWGAQALDVNGDGWQDLVIANSHLHGQPMKGQININQQGRFFAGTSTSSLDPMTQDRMGRGLSRLDWNRDGTHDLVITTLGGPAVLLQGTSTHSRKSLRFVGRKSPRDAMGTRIEVKISERPIVRSYNRGGGYLVSNEPVVILPADSVTTVPLHVTWPSGLVEQFDNLGDSPEYLIIEGQGIYSRSRP